MSNPTWIHIHRPKILDAYFAIRLKRKHKFLHDRFDSIESAIQYGLKNCIFGFSIYYRSFFKWYDPDNKLIAKIEKYKAISSV